MQAPVISILFRPIRPLFLLSGLLLYTLGVGMAHFYGASIDWNLLIYGLLWIISLQTGGSYLLAYFNFRADEISEELLGNLRFVRPSLLFIACVFLAIVAMLSTQVIRYANNFSIYILMFFMVIGAIAYSIPPLRLEITGYGELAISLLVANFIPALGYLLQGGDSWRLLTMVTFPLTVMHLAMLMAFSLSVYATEMKYQRRTLMQRIGWQNGMLLHNILILSAYLLLMLAVPFGLPKRIGIPAILTFPVGIFQIVMIQRIAAGAKPQWNILKVGAAAVFGITAYLLAFSFWIR